MEFFKEIDESISIDELKTIINNNILEANNLRKKIKKLEELNEKINFDDLSLSKEVDEIKIKEENPDLSEYEYYYENIGNVPIGTNLEELKEIIKDNISSKNNCNYFNIILYIKYRIDEEILTYASLLEQCYNLNDMSILNDIKVCIEDLKRKLSLSDKIKKKVKNI